MIFTYDNAFRYFTYRLPEEKIPARDSFVARCPFHPDRTGSLSINLKDGVWKCHAGCGAGGILDFEKMMFPAGNLDSWWESINKICGLEPNRSGNKPQGKLVATYDYVDPSGKLLYQKLRYDPKQFIQRAPKDNGGWTYTLNGIPRVLYQLPKVMTSQVVLVAEGEKDADNLNALDWDSLKNGLKPVVHPVATCNFDGAGPGKWKDYYSPFFAGKVAVIFPDNDEPGKIHAAEVAAAVAPFAHRIKIVQLPGLGEHGDVSDYLKDHTVADLMDAIRKTAPWSPPKPEEKPLKPFLVPPSEITKQTQTVEWIIPGVIHRGSKGLIVASPKAGKSMVAVDLAVALAAQQSWLGLAAPERQFRTAVISREDSPGLTKHRVWQFALARNVSMAQLDHWIRFNTHEQRATFSIQNEADCLEVIKWLKQEEIEFCIFDVLNVLHTADENSNTDMTAVMKRFDAIREATGVDLVVIHHDKKDSSPGQKKPRGASSIDSWWEWKVSISPDADNEEIKMIYFGSKATMAHCPTKVTFANDGEAIRIIPSTTDRYATTPEASGFKNQAASR